MRMQKGETKIDLVEVKTFMKNVELTNANALAKYLGISYPTAVRYLETLEEEGLVKREVYGGGDSYKLTGWRWVGKIGGDDGSGKEKSNT